MYLNVNLTAPSTGTDSLSSTPKTPEILNSLISLTASPLPPSYSSYQRQINRDVLSPTSSNDSPTDEVSATRFGATILSGVSQLSPTGSEPSRRKYSLTRSSRVFRGAKTSSVTGTPSPPVPELPSPVSTVEATKSALIKEGLKHQIKSKLQAAGVGPQTLLIDTTIKEEYSDSEESLTPQDEERRMRRRERNKIAATKCRNKKKERTIILMTESESVEDQNIRLKNEIQRLTSEKMKLEKLLDDPSHVASCRHSCGRRRSAPPLVVLTSPDAPELLSSTISEAPFTSGVSSSLIHQCTSEQNSDANTSLLYCSPNFPSSCESTFAINEPSPSSSYQTVSSGSSISPCSVSNISPSQNFLPKNIPQTCSQLSSVPTTSYGNDTTILELTPSKNSTSVCMSHLPHQHPSEAFCYDPEPHSSAVRPYLPIKSPSNLASRRHQPYASVRPTYTRPSPYSGQSSHDCIATSQCHEVQSQRDYIPNLLLDESGLANKDYSYSYEAEAKDLLSTDLSCGTLNQSHNINYSNNIGKIKSTTHNRYAPYNRANRNQPSQPSPSDGCSQNIQNIQLPEEYLQPSQSFDFQSSSNQFLTDLSNNTFYPPCTFGEL